jgi:hypothetical protein
VVRSAVEGVVRLNDDPTAERSIKGGFNEFELNCKKNTHKGMDEDK